MKVLITLGPTQEPIDKVRFISNASSGKMGKALAEESLKRNFSTTLISGPVNIKLPEKAKIIKVRTAREMITTTLQELEEGYDVFISVAAIADYSPEKVQEKKLDSCKEITLKLLPLPKLTKLVRKKFPELFIVGFKAEYEKTKEELIKRSLKKLIDDKLNLVVGNDLKESGFGSDEIEVYLVNEKSVEALPLAPKKRVAKKIWDKILEMIAY